MKFTYQGYTDLISLLQEHGYLFTDYHSYKNRKGEKTVILRHDIDDAIEKAAQMARLEHQLGCISTYFVLISTDLYNPFSKKNSSLLQEILSLGHAVGLHFDEVKYEENCDVVKKIQEEITVLEQCIGRKVTSVSMHRPSQKTLEADYTIPGVVNSYSREFFNDFKYLSDSRHHWREDVMEIVKAEVYPHLHILTHPFWYQKEEKDIRQTLLSFVQRAGKERYDILCDNIRDLPSIFSYQEAENTPLEEEKSNI